MAEIFPHAEYLIVEAMRDLLQPLVDAPIHIDRSRQYSQYEKFPQIQIELGEAETAAESNNAYRHLHEMHVDAVVVESELSQKHMSVLRKQIQTALLTDPKFGLSWLINTEATTASGYIRSAEGDDPTLFRRFTFVCHYRTDNQGAPK